MWCSSNMPNAKLLTELICQNGGFLVENRVALSTVYKREHLL